MPTNAHTQHTTHTKTQQNSGEFRRRLVDETTLLKMYDVGSDGNDASNPDSTAHDHADTHGGA